MFAFPLPAPQPRGHPSRGAGQDCGQQAAQVGGLMCWQLAGLGHADYTRRPEHDWLASNRRALLPTSLPAEQLILQWLKLNNILHVPAGCMCAARPWCPAAWSLSLTSCTSWWMHDDFGTRPSGSSCSTVWHRPLAALSACLVSRPASTSPLLALDWLPACQVISSLWRPAIRAALPLQSRRLSSNRPIACHLHQPQGTSRLQQHKVLSLK